MHQELQDLGLTEKESKVYLAALEIGRATADQLAKHTKIARPTTYLQIKSLMERGLMSTHEEGKKTYFAPESPDGLRRVLQLQKEALSIKEDELLKVLPELTKLYHTAGERPVVRFFPGKEGLVAVREEVLRSTSSSGKDLCIFFSPNRLKEIFSDKELDDYTSRREALGILSKGIYTDRVVVNPAILNPLTERRVFPENAPKLSVDIYIFGDRVGILSMQGSYFGLLIESQQISGSLRSLFDFFWNHSSPPTPEK